MPREVLEKVKHAYGLVSWGHRRAFTPSRGDGGMNFCFASKEK